MHSAVLRPDDRKDLLRKSGKEKFENLRGSTHGPNHQDWSLELL